MSPSNKTRKYPVWLVPALALVLCAIASGLMLTLPPDSLSVDLVYGEF